MTNKKIDLLIVEGNRSLLELMKLNLEKENDRFRIKAVNSASKALELIDQFTFDVIISDLVMTKIDGLEFLKKIRRDRNLKIPFIIFTRNRDEEIIINALNFGANRYFLIDNGSDNQYKKLAESVIQEYNQFINGPESENSLNKQPINAIRELSIPTFIIDSDHKIIEWNRAIENLTKIRRREIIGSTDAWKAFYPKKRPTLADLLMDGRIEEINDYFRKFVKAKHSLRGYTAEEWIKINNRELFIIITATAIVNTKGEVIQVIETLEDRTEQENIKERKEFLNSIFRHDASNMINVCHGYLNLLQDTNLSETQKKYITEAMSSARGVISIIEKVSKLQKIEREETKELSLTKLVRNVVEKSQFQANKKGIQIDLKIPSFSSKVQAGGLLEDVFINLIGNSIQHSGCNKINISGKETENEIICSIEDNGRGISEEDKKNVFNQGFKKGKHAGSGLGLFLVKRITENYRGTIDVSDSSLGGVKFDVHLKKGEPQSQTQDDPLNPLEGDLDFPKDDLLVKKGTSDDLILIVDDNSQFLSYMKILLENHGYQIETFNNAVNALEFLENLNYSSIPDLIISDIRMPEISGYDFFKKLSLDPTLNRIPFIFLSGLTSEDDIRLGKYLGVDDYITKPVQEKDILASIKGKLRRKKAERVFKTEINKVFQSEEKRVEKVDKRPYNEEIILFLIYWDDVKGPKLITQYPEKNTDSLSIDKLGTQIFQAIIPIYGQSKNIRNAEDLLFKIDNVNKYSYLYFDAFYDETKRSKQTEFMIAVIAPTISYFESLKLRKVLSELSSIIKEKKVVEKVILNFREFWKKVVNVLNKM